ncbi:MAG: flagellar hook-basal body complex protein, partial [Clostridiales bacterium]|nr:flagellar hook-basal body complex protein [Clostridiales bacterium]
MLRSLFSGVSGLKAHQSKMDVIGNNIANVNTYGFKASRTTFRDVYYQTISSASNASGTKGGSNASQIGYGTSVGSIDLLNTRSGFASTGLATDCYIDGEGYFVIKDGSGNERLTQVGTFSFDGNGNMVDGNKNFVCGYAVDRISGKVSVGGSTIDFGTDNGELLDGYTVKVAYADPDLGTDASASTSIVADTAEKTLTVTYTPAVASGAVTGPTTLTPDALQSALRTDANWSWTNNGA